MQKPRTARRSEQSCIISVRVIPRSSKVAIVSELPGQYRVKLTSPPVDGAANKQLVSVLARALSLSPANIEIVSGHTSRTKRLKILGISQEQLAAQLSPR